MLQYIQFQKIFFIIIIIMYYSWTVNIHILQIRKIKIFWFFCGPELIGHLCTHYETYTSFLNHGSLVCIY